MGDINSRKRDDNDTGKNEGTGVGAFRGDTMASALDPFGSAAVSVADSGGGLENNAGKGTDDDNIQDSKTRDWN